MTGWFSIRAKWIGQGRVGDYIAAMSYRTVEVEIDHGRIVTREPEKLPEKASGLLTILQPATPQAGESSSMKGAPRPFGLAKGQFVVPADFNAPLPEAVLRDFEGG